MAARRTALLIQVAFAALVLGLSLTAAPAGAALFHDETPELGAELPSSGPRTIAIDVVASPGQTLAATATLVVDGEAPVVVGASYVVVGYEPWFDGEYGVWVDLPVYDTSRARYSTSRYLTTGIHEFVYTVTEDPSGQTFDHMWRVGSVDCRVCHDDQPLAHNTSNCALCHTLTGPILKHNSGGFGGCGTCHGGSHGADRLDAHTYYDLGGDPHDKEARVCTHCHTPEYPAIPQIDGVHEGGPFLNTGAQHASARGYLSWDDAETYAGNSSNSPHGGYTANTNKCAVCHSVHQARPGGSVLTAYGPYATYAQGCIACHALGSTFTDVHITADVDGFISPHSTCTRCHSLGPHGVGASQYGTLAAKLLNTSGDAFIGTDLSASANGLVSAMFDGTGSGALTAQGVTLGTGYLCSACHLQAFSVNGAGIDPAGGAMFSGHRVLATATATWDGSAFGASLSGAGAVSWANADRCAACHDARDTSGEPAFPHGYVDQFGSVSPKTVAGSSYVWLTTASSVTDTRTILASAGTTSATTPNPAATELLTNDGLCLKCHRDGSTSGVGLSY